MGLKRSLNNNNNNNNNNKRANEKINTIAANDNNVYDCDDDNSKANALLEFRLNTFTNFTNTNNIGNNKVSRLKSSKSL